jgi:branched-chain amino acid aminotransferase
MTEPAPFVFKKRLAQSCSRNEEVPLASSEVLFVNGEYLSADGQHVSALDRGYTLGDGVFETMRATKGGIVRLRDHVKRLNASAATIRMPMPLDDESIRLALFTTLQRNGLAESDAILRLSISRGRSAQRGVLPDPAGVPTIVIRAMPFMTFPASKYLTGFRVILSSIRRNETSPLSRIKSLNYLDSIMSRVEAAETGVDDALMLNTRGHVACASASNLFIVTARGLVTPNLDSGVLAGVTRGLVLEQARALGLRVEEGIVTSRRLCASREAFLTNAAMGLMPVVEINGQAVGKGVPGPIVTRLSAQYQRCLEYNIEYR